MFVHFDSLGNQGTHTMFKLILLISDAHFLFMQSFCCSPSIHFFFFFASFPLARLLTIICVAALRTVEGKYGTDLANYFRFAKLLLKIEIWTFVLWVCEYFSLQSCHHRTVLTMIILLIEYRHVIIVLFLQ